MIFQFGGGAGVLGPAYCLLHRVETDHIAIRIENQRDVTIFSDGHFIEMNATAIGHDSGSFHCAVVAGKVDDGAASAGVLVLHFAESSCAAGLILTADSGENPHFEIGIRGGEFFQSDLEDVLVKGFGSLHVLDIKFEPADGITL